MWSLTRTSNLGEIVYAAVGRSSTVLLFDQGASFRLTTNGLPEAFVERVGMLPLPTVVHWLGMLPSLLRREARGGGGWGFVNPRFIPGAGDSTAGARYSFVDLSAMDGVLGPWYHCQ